MHRGLDVAAVNVVRISRQCAPDLGGLRAAREDGDAVPALLTVPDHAVSRIADRRLGEVLLRRLQLLQAHDVRGLLVQPAQEVRQPGGDSVDVIGDDPHGPAMLTNQPHPWAAGRTAKVPESGSRTLRLAVGYQRTGRRIVESSGDLFLALAGGL